MRDTIHLFLNGKPFHLPGSEAATTLSDWLRRSLGLVGTKVVCAEGDCGSCSVLVGRIVDDRMQYATVCSCIAAMSQLDATHVITIEGLKYGQRLNPIQSAMVSCHGAQCGFCTPGFVVAMTGLLERDRTADLNTVRRELVGNLCRCTGYESITASAKRCDRSAIRSLEELYPSGPIVAALSAQTAQALNLKEQTTLRPVTLAQATRFRADHPGCLVLAGGTDSGVLANKGKLQAGPRLVLGGVVALSQMAVTPQHIELGATVTVARLEAICRASFPELAEYLQWFGSPPIKNAATVAGNLATGSPIGDLLPPLLVMNAEVELTSVSGTRWVNLNSFYVGYRKSVMRPDELMTRIRIPLPAGTTTRFIKVSRRKDLDISTVSAAFAWSTQGAAIADVRVAIGGVAATVIRVSVAEAILNGGEPTLDRFAEAGRAAAASISPLDDVRGSAAYRLALAENVFSKCWHELFGQPSSAGVKE